MSQSTPQFTAGMLAPRYWGTWATLGLLWLVRWLPRRWVMGLGRRIGDRVHDRNRKRRTIVETNIALCFPELSDSARAERVRSHFHMYGIGLLDLGSAMMSNARQLERLCRVEGTEHLERLGESPVIVVLYHTTTLDMGGTWFLVNTDMVSMMKRDANAVINWFLYRARKRFGRVDLLLREDGLRGMVRGIRAGRLCLVIPDEAIGEESNSVMAPFYGQQKATLNTVSRLAAITGARVLPSLCTLDVHSGRYTTHIRPPLQDYPSDDPVRDATRLNAAMEALIDLAPEQYLWTFRWFRNSERGGADPYQGAA